MNYPILPIRIRGDKQKHFACSKVMSISPDDDVEVRFVPYKKDRSSAQRRLQHMWIGQIAKQRGDVTKSQCEAEFKLDYAIPILLESDEDYSDWWYGNEHNLWSREKALANMKFTPATRLMKVKPFNAYLLEIEMLSAQEGWRLTFPRDVYDEAMGIR